MTDEMYEPSKSDLDAMEMEEYDTSFDDSDAWVESMLVGLSGCDF